MANYSRDKIIVKCTFKTSNKDGKTKTFPTFMAVLKKQKYNVYFRESVKTDFPIIDKPVDGARYTVEKPVYNYDTRTIFNKVWIISANDIHEFTDSDIDIIEEND